MVEEKVQDGMSKKQARKEVAKETGLKENSIKVAHQRAEKKKGRNRRTLSYRM